MKLLLISPKNAYATRRLAQEAPAQSIELKIMEIAQLRDLNFKVDPAGFGALYIRQAYTEFKKEVSAAQLRDLIGFAKSFKDAGKVVVDAAIAEGDLGGGKYEALSRLRGAGVPIPQTSLLINTPLQEIAYPVITKWNYGFGAKHTYLVKAAEDLKKIEHLYDPSQILVQQFIKADSEYKVITVGYKSLPVIIKLKTNNDKFLPDLQSRQIITAAEAPGAIKVAETAAKTLKRELAKVDILEVAGRFYLLEANRWPGFQYFEKASKYNVAAEFLRYLSASCKKS
jgi:glutathione synthase/RimK-type ligase-like ATP-grasp enzyme